jgi:hypothetical protein
VSDRPDILLLSLGTTLGWRVADSLFVESLRRAGVDVAAVTVGIGATGAVRRAYPVTDLIEAFAARRTLDSALDRYQPRAIVISSTTAAMLADTRGLPYAVRLDAPASINRPGPQNAVLHRLERRALGGARLVLPWSIAAREALPPGSAQALVVPPPLTPSGPPTTPRQRLAVAYTPDVKAKGLDVVCGAWAAAELHDDARLEVFGVDPQPALAHLQRTGTPLTPGLTFRGKTAPADFRAALRAATVYVGGARWEDYGQAPLEALADGALLATVPSNGPFEALALARELAPNLVATEIGPEPLAAALKAAFDMPETDVAVYRQRAAGLLDRFRPEAIDRTIATDLIPTLLG